jgi:aspartate aminotransferase-like enzyme
LPEADLDFEQFEDLNFRLPGPTPLPPTVRSAMDRPSIHHRGPLLKSMMRSISARLKVIHRTEGDVLVWPGSGSAGWEIAITNMLCPGDHVAVTVCGSFGERFALVAAKLGLVVHRVERPWGAAILPDELQAVLDTVPQCRAVLITHNETSTGVANPLADLAAVARNAGALVIVDAVSSAGALPLETDEWGLDFVISGSQKAWMCPPGLVICAIGERVWPAYDASTYPRFFWDIATAKAAAADGMTPTTPPLPLLFALDAALELMDGEGVDAIWSRHQALGEYARKRVSELGLQMLADPMHASDSLTAIHVPDGTSARAIIDCMVRNHRVMLQAGQGELADQILRVGHMGWVTQDDLRVAFDALGETLASAQFRAI